jgi:DNA mismatch endonuclease (patch repair protein)
LANRRRDEDANRVLRDRGWRVLRFWEHDEPKEAATIVANAVLNDTAAGGAGTAVERGQECGTV